MGETRGQGADGRGAVRGREALRHGALLWSAEVALARITGWVQTPGDLAVSALAIGLVLAGAVALGRGGLGARRAGGVASRAPLAAVALSVASPAATHAAAGVGLAAAVALWLARGSVVVREGRDPLPGPLVTLAALGGASGLAWVAALGVPPPAMLLGVVAAGTLLGLLVRRPAGVAAAAALTAGLALTPDPPPSLGSDPGAPVPEAPDLVLITVDTLRADAAEAMESYRRLAAQGVAFSEVQAPAPWTLPSMASLFTGLPVAEHGAGRLASGRFAGLPDEADTLAARLSGAGYDTVAVVAANPFVGSDFGFGRGFGHLHAALVEGHFGLPRWPDSAVRPTAAELSTLAGAWPRRYRGDADALVGEAVALLDGRSERPLFLWLHLLDPHLPYAHAAQAPIASRWRRALTQARNPRRMAGAPEWAGAEARAALRAAYAHEVARVDAALLRLLAELGPAPARGRLVVLTADHGEEFFEHGGFEHGHAFYQEVLRVPLVIADAPGVAPGRRAEPAGLVDLAPTLLAAAGLDTSDLPGRDLLAAPREAAYASRDLLYPEDEGDEDSYAVRHGAWKVVVRGAETELYDLERDPAELHDLAARRPDVAARVAALAGESARRGEGVELGTAEAEALRALGYLAE